MTAAQEPGAARGEVLPNSGEFTMRTSWPVACAAVLILGLFSSGCSATGKTAPSAATEDGSNSSAQGDGIHQYRAVCTEKALHDGNEYVLSKWLETRDQAKGIGDYHGWFKYKGHQIRIEERVNPKKVTP
jgi:hypothetical protein